MSQHGAPFIIMSMLRRDLTLAARRRSEWLNPLYFFVIVVSLFPLGIGPEPGTLRIVAPGIIWVAALLASMLSLDSLFRSDYEDGTLEQMLISSHSMWVLVLGKVLAHWLMTGLPLVLLSPLLAVSMNLNGQAIVALMATLALGTPILSLVGSIGAALTVSLKQGGVLLSLLVLPLYTPVLIFAAAAVDAAGAGVSIEAHLSFLGALLVLGLTLAPLAAAGALRVGMN